jgi:hypothetical protein
MLIVIDIDTYYDGAAISPEVRGMLRQERGGHVSLPMIPHARLM